MPAVEPDDVEPAEPADAEFPVVPAELPVVPAVLDPPAADPPAVDPLAPPDRDEPMLAFISMYPPRLEPVVLDAAVEPDVPVADEPLPFCRQPVIVTVSLDPPARDCDVLCGSDVRCAAVPTTDAMASASVAFQT